jgi:cytochrome c oxidase subunit 1
MALLLSLFFNDYGLPSGKAWIFFAIIICIIAIFSMVFDEDAYSLPSCLISGCGFALYLVSFFSIAAINQYEHIPISGTDIQKTNLKRCTVGKTITLENIEDIMTECQNRDQEMKLKAGIESLGK